MKHSAQSDEPNATSTPSAATPQAEVPNTQVQQGSRIDATPLVEADASAPSQPGAAPSDAAAPSQPGAAPSDAAAPDAAQPEDSSLDEQSDSPAREISQEDAEMSETILQLASKRMRRKWIILIVVLALVIIGGIAAFIFLTSSTPEEAALKPDPNVQVGSVTGSTQDLEKIVDEGMLTFSINTTPSFQSGKSSGNMMIENSEINNNRFTVTIFRDDTKETIYQSGTLDPGQYINDVALDVSLPAGQYPCTARFNTYSLSDNKPIGQAAAKITIHVLS